MPEQQNIEYKSIWKDEYLKWVCGFANAQGGIIYIGKDDNGNIAGVRDSKKLLEEIPNKITTVLGIVADVNLSETEQGNFIEIIVEPHPNPVNYKGEYHYRSGSTKQELKGAALDKFLLQKQGKCWDGVPVPNVTVADLKQETFDFFKEKGIQSKRLDEKSRRDTNEQFIDNLQLKENKYLKRAALLLFHPTPEKFVTGAYVKIGYFQTDSDLLFQDDIHGNLFEQVCTEIDLSKLSLNKRQLDAIKFFKEQKEISTSDYMKRYNISERTARYDLAELVEKNILVKFGDNKATTYIFQ